MELSFETFNCVTHIHPLMVKVLCVFSGIDLYQVLSLNFPPKRLKNNKMSSFYRGTSATVN